MRVLALSLMMAWSALAADKPNVLFIMSDDHAAHAIGAYGSRLARLDPTPNIDRLADEGMLLQNVFCTNAICTPSRATIITGQYSHVNGVKTLNERIEPARQHLARLMGQAGYETAIIGKWHLKEEPAAFDYYAVLPGQGSYFNPILRIFGGGAWPDNVKRFAAYDNSHSTDVIAKLSLDWLKGRDKSKPFFLMHHFKAPHDNFENAERYDFLYEDTQIPEPESLWRQPNHGSEATKGTGTSVGKRNKRRNMGHHMFVDPELGETAYKRTAYQRYLKKYLRTVRGVDDAMGRLLEYLEESGELDNTVIFYTADQGFMLGEHDYIDKRWMYEEALRMPFLARYPKAIRAGSRSDAIINNTDFAPTMLEFAGVSKPDFMQGR
ncbi:MAG: sulfatase-like hydrolase/transferase, partial [bacterium]|nr:sulfatase-like hydrolase/transferase [bacterium]